MEITPQIAYTHLDKFKTIWENNKRVNPMPDNIKLTVYCKDNNGEGFCINVNLDDMGLTALVAQKYILHDELIDLVNNDTIN